MQRKLLFNNLAHNRALVLILVDHRRQKHEIANMEYEVVEEWTGDCTKTKEKVSWAHSPAWNKHVGGISIAIHPVLGRYATAKLRVDKWGRWVEVDIIGKNTTVTTIVGTYGPTGSSRSGEQPMWAYQQEQIRGERENMAKIQTQKQNTYR